MTYADSELEQITFAQFSDEWLREFTDTYLSPFEKGQKFAYKLVSQWLNVAEGDEDLVLCDGSGDGGIDIAYLHRAAADDDGEEGQTEEGDTWYLIQSKYGSSFQGQDTVFLEGRKVIATLSGENQHLSERTRGLVGRINTFMERASPRDRLILVFATSKPINEDDRRALDDIRALGRQKFPGVFDVEDISLQTLWENRDEALPSISVEIQGDFVEPSSGLRVGTIPLTHLFKFLKDYKGKTGNLDQLYEKNVRQFLGGRRKINRGIAHTLQTNPKCSDFTTMVSPLLLLILRPRAMRWCCTIPMLSMAARQLGQFGIFCNKNWIQAERETVQPLLSGVQERSVVLS